MIPRWAHDDQRAFRQVILYMADKRKKEDLVLIGAKEAAQIMGWNRGATFKRNRCKLRHDVRNYEYIKGTQFALEDVLLCADPTLTERELSEKIRTYTEAKKLKDREAAIGEYVGCAEAARIMGWNSGSSFKRNLHKMPSPIRTKRGTQGKCYLLMDIFRCVYPEHSREVILELMIQYRQERARARLERGKRVKHTE